MGHHTKMKRSIAALLTLWVACPFNSVYAVVGQAEDYDQFQRKDLEDFHDSVVNEEQRFQLQRSDELKKQLQMAELNSKSGKTGDKDIDESMEVLKSQLLQLPKRDRFRIELDGQYRFDSNPNRMSIYENEKSDSIFDVYEANLFDLSGRKTDLRFEVNTGRQWNVAFSDKDFSGVEERIRYRRKYFKKITHSVNSAISRQNQKTVEINSEKVRWDSQQTTAFNYAFSNKLSINTQFEAIHRYFSTKAFKRDSYWEASAAPSVFWNFTPKSRISAGYRLGTNRIRSKVGNANSHEIHLGYFGRVTRKSSISADLAVGHQTPKSTETDSINSYTIGLGYIWQMTPKTQIFTQIIRNVQNTTSNAIVNSDQVTKTDTHFTNESLSVSLNTRLNRKLSAVLTMTASHPKTSVQKGGDEDNETQQFEFPMSFTINYYLRRWVSLSLGYTFVYRLADEHPDEYRDHILQTAAHLSF
jgi:hypothetical protein